MSYIEEGHLQVRRLVLDEEVYVDIDGRGYDGRGDLLPEARADPREVGYTYAGDVEGTSTLTYLIAYKADAAPVLGLEQFAGSVDGHEGSCVFRHVGGQDAGSVHAHGSRWSRAWAPAGWRRCAARPSWGSPGTATTATSWCSSYDLD